MECELHARSFAPRLTSPVLSLILQKGKPIFSLLPFLTHSSLSLFAGLLSSLSLFQFSASLLSFSATPAWTMSVGKVSSFLAIRCLSLQEDMCPRLSAPRSSPRARAPVRLPHLR